MQVKATVRRQIILATGSDLLSTFSAQAFNFAVGLYLLALTGSAFSFSLILLVGPCVTLGLAPLVGKLVDAYKHQHLLVISQLFSCGGLVAFLLLLFLLPQQRFVWIILAVIWLRALALLTTTAYQASVVYLVPVTQQQRLNSLEQAANSLATIVAPIIAAAAYTSWGFIWFVYVEIFGELLNLLAFTQLDFSFAGQQQIPKKSAQQRLCQTFSYLWRIPALRLLLLFGLQVNFFISVLNVGLPYVLLRQLHFTNSLYAFTDSMLGIGMVAAGLSLAKRKLRWPLKIIVTMIFIFGGLLLILALVMWLPVYQLLFVCMVNFGLGFCLLIINTLEQTFMQQTVPRQQQGHVFALFSAAVQIMIPLGALFYGYCFDHYSAVWLFAGTGASILLFSGLLWRYYQTVTRQ